MTITVLLADDHPVVRKGIASLLAEDPMIQVVGEAKDGPDAVKMILDRKPHVALVDIAMTSMNGIQVASTLQKQGSPTKIIMLSMYSDEEYVMRALRAGARGYLVKDAAEPDILQAIHKVAGGGLFFSSVISDVLLSGYVRRLRDEDSKDSYDLLTDREKEILRLLATAKSNKEVAAELHLSPATVETHRNNLMQKLDLHSAAEIVLYAVRKKIIEH